MKCMQSKIWYASDNSKKVLGHPTKFELSLIFKQLHFLYPTCNLFLNNEGIATRY